MNTGIPARDLGQTLGSVLGPRAVEITMTTAEQLKREGRTEGRAEAQREYLVRVLQSRFGALDAATRARVFAADLDTVDAWFDRALTAEDLRSVFDE